MRRWLAALLLAAPGPALGLDCAASGVGVQVLGSGGAELHERRAASGSLVWHNGQGRVLVNAGPGVALRFVESGARLADLDVVLFTRLHAEHSADLVALIETAGHEERRRALPVFGPPGGPLMPSTVAWVRALLDRSRGAYRYLGELLTPLDRSTYKLRPYDVVLRPEQRGVLFRADQLAAAAVPAARNGAPGLAWRVEIADKSIVFAGDGLGEAIERLAQGADLLIVAHVAVEGDKPSEVTLRPAPAAIGQLAQAAQARQLVLAPRGARTRGREDETLAEIRKKYDGPVAFANDLDCFAL